MSVVIAYIHINPICVMICVMKMSQVAAVPEDVGTAGAIRAIAHHLTAKDILVNIPLPCPLNSEF